MAKITRVWSREILDSRGYPTLETAVSLDTNHLAVASVPSGASTGRDEALELRDNDPNRFGGKGVLKAVENVNQVLGPAVVGKDPANQQDIDNTLISLDGTKNKSKYGANSILSISAACVKVASLASGKPLYSWVGELAGQTGLEVPMRRVPTPIFNMINGGLHGAGNLDFQEFHVIPATSKTFSDGLRSGVEIYHALGGSLARRGAIHSVGDEGGYAPNLFTNADALAIVIETIRETKYAIGRDVFLGLDVAANTFYQDGAYTIRDKSTPMNEQSLIDYFKDLNSQYRLALLEDPLDEDSWEGWKALTSALQSQSIIVGDDLLVTNPERVAKAVGMGACNAILVKPNQIGTITETLKVVKQSKDAGWRIIVSHRSGETNDWFISDFAVGVAADYVKFGAPSRGERVAKYNRLLSIEAELAIQG